MIKNLRSLIQEKFSLDLRVQIELISRRRDITNKEKHQEIIKLLQSFSIEVVPLGPGTNRYAFKLDGFVVKVATDHDGKIDNLKEFKMAKRLYPYVTKIYEVSENGTLLVAEYIQPFGSYTEMYKHADEIRDILSKLSSVYLIGDVGITAKNFANWGLRIGSDDPVCLDFAYVYEVSSELFICRNCNTNSMLVPNRDFTELYCPNKGCGKHYLFEDIRARIGNDIHKHEIGDLSLEGYKLSASSVPTELDETRSNYLARKKDKKEEVKEDQQEEVEANTFEMEFPPSYYIEHQQGGKQMNIFESSKLAAQELVGDGPSPFKFSDGTVINVKAETASLDGDKVIEAKAFAYDPDDTDDSYDRDEKDSKYSYRPPAIYPSTDPTGVAVHDTNDEDGGLAFEWKMDTTPDKPNTPDTVVTVAAEAVPVEQVGSTKKLFPNINDHFVNSGSKSFSKLANSIGYHMTEIGLREMVGSNLRDRRMTPDQFYRIVQNAVFRSLGIFCNFKEVEVPNMRNAGTHKEFTLPDQINGTEYEPTMVFVARFWNNDHINECENPSDIMIAYRDCFSDYQGIQREWLPYLDTRLRQKLNITSIGIKKIVDTIAEHWCVLEEEDEIPQEPEVLPDENEEVAFSGSYEATPVEVAQDPTEEEYDGEEGEEVPAQFSVEIFYDDSFDVIKVNSGEAFGPISIPFYTKMDNIVINPNEHIPSIGDDRNGVWDWLIHIVPDMMFRTKNPDEWLKVNNYADETNQLHIVIMHEDPDGTFIMGIYYLTGIFIVDDEGVGHPTMDPDILAKLNKLIRDDIGYGSISHLNRSLSMEELIRPEEYVSQIVEYEDEDPDDFEDADSANRPGNDPEDVPEESTLEDAAIKSIMADTGIEESFIDHPAAPVPAHETAPQPQKKESAEPIPVKKEIPNQVAPGVFKPIRRNE